MIFYQAARFLEEAVKSVLAQTYSSWELLLVDDGSTDAGSELARRYAALHPDQIRYLQHEGHRNLGMSAARNLGVRLARGQYIAFLDADDAWLPNALDDQVRILDENPDAAMVYGRTLYWHSWTGKPEDADRDGLMALPVEPETLVEPPDLLTKTFSTDDSWPAMGSFLVRRAVIEGVGGSVEDFRGIGEDHVLWGKIFAHHRVYVSGGLWVRYRQHLDSEVQQVNRDPQRALAAMAAVRHWFYRYLSDSGIVDPEVWRAIREEINRTAPAVSVIEAREMVLAPPDPRLVGYHVGHPLSGARSVRASIELRGWVIGQSARQVALEVVHEGRVVRRLPLDPRPDLVKAFPKVAHAEHSGFRTFLEVLGMDEVELGLQAVLADQDRVPIATLRLARRWREDVYHAAAPLVSVVIPCYDQAHYLHEAIESVNTQSYPHLELVVVDDGSHDNTAAVTARYPGVKLVRQDNAGLSDARNTGLRHTSGAYLIFLDADDRLLPNAVADGLAAFKKHPEAAFVAGRHRLIDAEGMAIIELPRPDLADDPYEALLRRNVIAMHGAVMYQRITLQRMGGFHPALDACEDYDLYLRIARKMPIHSHEELVAEYRRHGSAISDDIDRMRRASLHVLAAHGPAIRRNRRLREAINEGRRFWRAYYPARERGVFQRSSATRRTADGGGAVAIGDPTRATSAPSRRRHPDKRPARVLMYHRIAEPDRDPFELAVSPRHFAAHLEILRRHSRVISLADAVRALEDGGLPEGAAVVTFDDGYADNLHAALPLLERHDVPAAVFLSTGYIGRPSGFWWDELERLVFEPPSLPPDLRVSVRGTSFDFRSQDHGNPNAVQSAGHWRAWEPPSTMRQSLYQALYRWMKPLLDSEREQALTELAEWGSVARTPARECRSLSWLETAQMAEHPLLELGAHTVTHPQLSAMTPAMQRLEVRASQTALEAIIRGPVMGFAYPFGAPIDIGTDTVRIVAEAGYRAAFVAVPSMVGGHQSPFQVPRLHVADWDGEEFARRLSGSGLPTEPVTGRQTSHQLGPPPR